MIFEFIISTIDIQLCECHISLFNKIALQAT